MTHQRLRVWHLLWGNGRQRPKESTKTRTKLMLEGIGDAYRLLVGLDATCKGWFWPVQKRWIGCTNRRCQKLEIARSELVWCQSVKHRCGRQLTRTEGRSLAQAATFGLARIVKAVLVRLPSEEIRRCRQTSSFVKKRFSSKSCRQSLRALLVWPVPRGELQGEQSHCRSRRGDRDESYLVDPASSHMLVSKIKPCMSKYKLLYCETANGSLNQLSSIWLCPYYMDNRSNSRANTCEKSRLLEGMYLLD